MLGFCTREWRRRVTPVVGRVSRVQARFLKRQLSSPVSMMSEWWVSRSTRRWSAASPAAASWSNSATSCSLAAQSPARPTPKPRPAAQSAVANCEGDCEEEKATTFGSAKWSSIWTLYRKGMLRPQGLLVGDWTGRLGVYHDGTHTIMFGVTGAQKGVAAALPNLPRIRTSSLSISAARTRLSPSRAGGIAGRIWIL